MTYTDIKNFYSLADTKIKLIEQVRKYFGKETSPRFNSFDFWWIDENKVSQILAFFLDPKQNHEQGDIYLRHFMKKFGLERFAYGEDDRIYVQCELSTDAARRIDIVVYKNKFEWAIGIENKIYVSTADQCAQLEDYHDYLHAKTGDYCLIYLSPKGKVISTNSLSSDRQTELETNNAFRHLTYEEHLIECIAEFAMMTESIRVRSFLKDFETTLKRMYMGVKDLEAKEAIVDFMGESDKNLEISFLVMNSLAEVKEQLKEQLKLQVKEIINELGLVGDETNFRPSNWKKHYFCYRIDRTELYYGITRNYIDNDNSSFLTIQNLVKDKLKGNYLQNGYWPLYAYIDRNIDSSPDSWIAIKNGEAKRELFDFVQLIIDNFNTDEY